MTTNYDKQQIASKLSSWLIFHGKFCLIFFGKMFSRVTFTNIFMWYEKYASNTICFSPNAVKLSCYFSLKVLPELLVQTTCTTLSMHWCRCLTSIIQNKGHNILHQESITHIISNYLLVLKVNLIFLMASNIFAFIIILITRSQSMATV